MKGSRQGSTSFSETKSDRSGSTLCKVLHNFEFFCMVNYLACKKKTLPYSVRFQLVSTLPGFGSHPYCSSSWSDLKRRSSIDFRPFVPGSVSLHCKSHATLQVKSSLTNLYSCKNREQPRNASPNPARSKIMSSDRPAPCVPPSLPIEVLVMISEFLAGDDCLGTLADFNVASRVIHQETLPVLYETAV